MMAIRVCIVLLVLSAAAASTDVFAQPAAADAAVDRGRVYLMDYAGADRQRVLRCLSLADGREIWRYAYPLSAKRNHGVTRTVPSVADPFPWAGGCS